MPRPKKDNILLMKPGRSTKDGMTADEYERHKAAVMIRNRENVVKSQDIGATFDFRMPLPEDADRREQCRNNFPLFVQTYSDPDWKPFSPVHYDSMRHLGELGVSGGKMCQLMPRNYAKTTIGEFWILWGQVYGHFQLVESVFSCDEFAQRSVESLQRFIEFPDGLFAKDFPEVHIPAIALEGVRMRCNGQRWGGRRTQIDWCDERLVFPVVPKPGMSWEDGEYEDIVAECSGWCLLALGAKSTKIHGAKFTSPRDGKTYRPSAILIDDWNDDTNATSPTQNAKYLRIIKNGLGRSRSVHKKFSMLYNGTCFAPGDIGDQLANPLISPDWQGIRISALKEWPKNREMWDRYGEMLRDFDVNAGPGDVRSQAMARKRADAYYDENRAAMDEGAVVTWEEAYAEQEGERSALHALMLVYYTAGPEVFACACQNQPLDPAEVEGADRRIRPMELLTRLNNYERGEIPADCEKLTAFVDLQDRVLYWLVAAWSPKFTGYVIDYGTFPRQVRTYFKVSEFGRDNRGITLEAAYMRENKRTAGKEALWRWGLEKVSDMLCGRSWTRDDDVEMRMDRLLFDANDGEAKDVVFEFCRQSVYPQSMPSTGTAVRASQKPFPLYEQRVGEQRGDYWLIPASTKRKSRYVRADVNYWKTFIRSRFRTPVGDPGALTIFGKGVDHQSHALLFDHLSAEYSVQTSGPHGTCNEWSLTPGAENHWWDCLVGTAIAASLEGVSRPGAGEGIVFGKRRWRTLKEARAMRGLAMGARA